MRSTCTTRNPSLHLAEPGGERHPAKGWWQLARKAVHRRNPRFLRGTANSSRAGTSHTGSEGKAARGSRTRPVFILKLHNVPILTLLKHTPPSASIWVPRKGASRLPLVAGPQKRATYYGKRLSVSQDVCDHFSITVHQPSTHCFLWILGFGVVVVCFFKKKQNMKMS